MVVNQKSFDCQHGKDRNKTQKAKESIKSDKKFVSDLWMQIVYNWDWYIMYEEFFQVSKHYFFFGVVFIYSYWLKRFRATISIRNV